MNGSKFTVVLPVRNGGTYVHECVASILGQTRGDFDLLILENGSTDGTAEWLAGLADPRIRVVPAPTPLSIEQNWGRILTTERSEFMTIIGHDDVLEPHFLETIAQLVDEHPDAAVYQTHFRIIDKDGAVVRFCRPIPARETAAEYLSGRLCWTKDIFGTGYVFRSADYDRVGGIPLYHRLLYSDDALWLRLMTGSWKACDLGAHFSVREHVRSVSRSVTMIDQLQALERHRTFLDALAQSDAAVATVMERYGPQYFAEYCLGIHAAVLAEALETGKQYPEELRTRLEELNRASGDLRLPISRRMAFHEWAYRRRSAGRLIFKAAAKLESLVRDVPRGPSRGGL